MTSDSPTAKFPKKLLPKKYIPTFRENRRQIHLPKSSESEPIPHHQPHFDTPPGSSQTILRGNRLQASSFPTAARCASDGSTSLFERATFTEDGLATTWLLQFEWRGIDLFKICDGDVEKYFTRVIGTNGKAFRSFG
ncbi:hypothetical protein JTE90_001437 [Oedothorax gibbosus]|uniref:Uncharacterized protein n=1 Tax=Oedothorax gibbosus TaxID=931172 RepID=A0AAV6V1S1_9ARAC|nr:hypothetical protein JTE90_001437 [Oedothorax gibbosus]